MEVHHIRYFLAVCATLNFTKASAHCNVSQPALSRAIQQLEQELGGHLFLREKSGIRPTDLCLLLRPQFETVFTGMLSAKRDASRFLNQEKSNIKLGIMCSVGPQAIAKLLAEFNRTQPGISISMSEGMPDELSGKLGTGELDVAIMAHPEGFNDGIWWREMYSERFILALSLAHKFTEKTNVTFEELNGESYLSRTKCEYDGHIDAVCEKLGVGLPVRFSSERDDLIQNLVAAGFGLCIIPEFSATIPGIVTRPLTPEIKRRVCVTKLQDKVLPKAAQNLVEFLVKNYCRADDCPAVLSTSPAPTHV